MMYGLFFALFCQIIRKNSNFAEVFLIITLISYE